MTISSVNSGKDYIYDETAVNLFGWIYDTVDFDDVTLPENLLKKGKNYLSSVVNESMTIELSATDLHNLNCDIEKFKLGDWVRVISIPHKLDRYFLVSKLSLDLSDPKSSSLVLGETFSTLTRKQLDENNSIKQSIVSGKQVNESIRQEVSTIRQDVTNINNVIVEIPDEYVDTVTFTAFINEVNKKLGRVYTVKGSVANYATLGNLQNNEIGDVYNIIDTGANYVYTEDGWDKLSENIDLSEYMTKSDAEKDYVRLIDYEKLVERVKKIEEGGITNG